MPYAKLPYMCVFIARTVAVAAYPFIRGIKRIVKRKQEIQRTSALARGSSGGRSYNNNDVDANNNGEQEQMLAYVAHSHAQPCSLFLFCANKL